MVTDYCYTFNDLIILQCKSACRCVCAPIMRRCWRCFQAHMTMKMTSSSIITPSTMPSTMYSSWLDDSVFTRVVGYRGST